VAEIFSAGGAAVVVLVLVGVVALVLWGSIASVRGRASTSSDPQRILKERLARGEIDAEEYDRLSELIGSDDSRYYR